MITNKFIIASTFSFTVLTVATSFAIPTKSDTPTIVTAMTNTISAPVVPVSGDGTAITPTTPPTVAPAEVSAPLASPVQPPKVEAPLPLKAANECELPITEMIDPRTKAPFKMEDLTSRTAGLSERIRGRYLVADLNTTDKSGMCRGIEETYPNLDQLSDFPEMQALAQALKIPMAQVPLIKFNVANPASLTPTELATQNAAIVAIQELDLNHLDSEVSLYNNLVKLAESFRKESPLMKRAPMVKAALGGAMVNLCIGQRIVLCEIQDGKPTMVARFVTSSAKNWAPARNYYAEMNEIVNIRWNSRRAFGPLDLAHDKELGWPANSGHDQFIKFQGKWEMPNFMNWHAAPGFTGEPNNGIHEIAGGLDSGGAFGSPVSLGCFRLRKYTSMFARWFTPKGAKLFINYSPQQYSMKADENGKGL